MPLPTIATPTYSLELPSTKKTIKYRPFLVKEEKLLVLALETESQKEITTAVKSVIKNCIQTRGVKVETLPTFDIEYLFLNIRGKSVGEEVEVNIVAPDDGVTQIPVTIDLAVLAAILATYDGLYIMARTPLFDMPAIPPAFIIANHLPDPSGDDISLFMSETVSATLDIVAVDGYHDAVPHNLIGAKLIGIYAC